MTDRSPAGDPACVFCQIVSRRSPARIEYEDDEVLAFHDIYPKAPIHLLIVPKRHIASVMVLDPADAPLVGRLVLAAARLGEARGLAERGYRLALNCGPEGGQVVYHLHLHFLAGRRDERKVERRLIHPSRLDNGLTLVVREHDAAPVAAVQLWVGVGARHEEPAVAGVSHFIEHLLFKGTPRRGPGVIDETIASLGGDMNAATSQDFTCYHVVLPHDHLRTAIDVLADAARDATLDADELERERLVVLEEIRRAEDDPQSVLWRVLAGRHYDPHPYGKPVLGTMETISGVTREQVVAYHRRHYVPANAALVVAGRVQPAEVEALVAEYFGPWSGGPAVGAPPAPAPPVGGRRGVELVRPLQEAYVALGWAGPRVGSSPADADVYATEVLVAVLGRGRTSRLYQALRERRGLVPVVSASYYLQHDAGIVLVTARAAPGRRHEVADAALHEIGQLIDGGVDEEELGRALTAIEASHAFGYETAEGVAYAFGLAQTVFDLDFELTFMERVREVTAADVRDAAARYLDPAAVTVATLGPGPDGSPGD